MPSWPTNVSRFFSWYYRRTASLCRNDFRKFMAHYELNTGVYVLKNDKGDVYVGKSEDITKRLAFHNKGMGATFTIGSRWWRIAPLRPSDAPPPISYTPETAEMLLQQDRAKKTGGGRVRGGAFTATRRIK